MESELVRCEAWEDDEGDVVFGPYWSIEAQRAVGALGEHSKLLYAFDALTWRAAATEHNRRLGFGEYTPPPGADVDSPLIDQRPTS